MSWRCKAHAKLSADHSGLIDAPVLTAHCPPAPIYQDLHPSFQRISPSCQTYLRERARVRERARERLHNFKTTKTTDSIYINNPVFVCVSLTVADRPVLGTLQRTETSWLCLQVYSGTSRNLHCLMELSCPVHCTEFIWIGPVPEKTKISVQISFGSIN